MQFSKKDKINKNKYLTDLSKYISNFVLPHNYIKFKTEFEIWTQMTVIQKITWDFWSMKSCYEVTDYSRNSELDSQ